VFVVVVDDDDDDVCARASQKTFTYDLSLVA
jgi:hypothetical protein